MEWWRVATTRARIILTRQTINGGGAIRSSSLPFLFLPMWIERTWRLRYLFRFSGPWRGRTELVGPHVSVCQSPLLPVSQDWAKTARPDFWFFAGFLVYVDGCSLWQDKRKLKHEHILIRINRIINMYRYHRLNVVLSVIIFKYLKLQSVFTLLPPWQIQYLRL